MNRNVGPTIVLLLLLPVLAVGHGHPDTDATGRLQPNFYGVSCPKAEEIVFNVMCKNKDKKGTIPGITRLLFHDCFVTGCDASLLLLTSPSNQTELSFPGNGVTIRGLDVIAEIKSELEKHCPGVVSCSDILAFAARDAAVLSGNPHFPMPSGRRDSRRSAAEDAEYLPTSYQTMDQMVASFGEKDITFDGFIALLGAHSIGLSRCSHTVAKKENLVPVGAAAKALDPAFARAVEAKCPNLAEDNVPFNVANESGPWGVSYYRMTLRGQAILPSDLGVATDPPAVATAQKYAADPALWARKYNEALTTMSMWNVLTGNQGEIRVNCGYVNK